MSVLRNRPVIYREKQIGLLQSIGLDTAQKTVQVLIIAGGFKGKQVVFADQIRSMTTDAVFVCDTYRYRKEYEPVRLRFVKDETGLLVGKITDYLIDEKTMNVAAFEMMRGFLTRDQREKIWVFSWSPGSIREDEIMIPNGLSDELTDECGEA